MRELKPLPPGYYDGYRSALADGRLEIAGLTARAERTEDAIQRVRELAEQYAANRQRGGFGQIPVAQLLAALDSTDPPLDAQRPEERSDEGPKKTDAEWWMQIALNTANRYGDLLGTILSKFTEKGHPGEPCVRTGWIPERLVAEWRDRAAGGQLDAPAPTRSGEERPVIPVVLNPEAVGDPTQTPRVYIGPLQERL